MVHNQVDFLLSFYQRSQTENLGLDQLENKNRRLLLRGARCVAYQIVKIIHTAENIIHTDNWPDCVPFARGYQSRVAHCPDNLCQCRK